MYLPGIPYLSNTIYCQEMVFYLLYLIVYVDRCEITAKC